jgi:succinate--hydroxymethylglutarate CoA-transferase
MLKKEVNIIMSEFQKGPLSGIKVIEFGQIAAGPFTGMLLGDLGADIVKVERPDSGDGMREWPPFFTDEGGEVFSSNFASLNRNKRSIAIDFKNADQLKRLQQLCQHADVIIENYRPGVLSKFGLGYADLKQANPSLIYCSISGYGQTGQYAQKGAFDVTVQAISGLMSVTGDEAGSPAKCGVPVADFTAGLYSAYTIVAALLQAKQTGEGTYIDCSMLGSLLGISALQTSEYFGNGKVPKRLGTAHPRNAPYQGFQGLDKPFVIAAGNDKLWREVSLAVNQPELANDPRFLTQALRAKNQKDLAALLQVSFSKKTAADWLEEFDRRGVPCAPINTFEDILNDPVIRELELLEDLELPGGQITLTVPFPVKLSGFEYSIYRRPPKKGEHTEQVFQEWQDN